LEKQEKQEGRRRSIKKKKSKVDSTFGQEKEKPEERQESNYDPTINIQEVDYNTNKEMLENKKSNPDLLGAEKDVSRDSSQKKKTSIKNFNKAIELGKEPSSPNFPSSSSNSRMNSLSSERGKVVSTVYEIPKWSKKNRVFYFFFKISDSDLFGGFIIFLIIMNTLVLALDRHPIGEWESEFLNLLNEIFSWFFLLEMIIKLLGLGPKAYFIQPFNQFDFLIVMVSTIEMAIGWAGVGLTGGAISALRSLRILRIFKLAKSWTSFRILLGQIVMSLEDIGYFSVLMALFMFIYTLLGMELYAYKVQFDDQFHPAVNGTSPRENFDQFLMGLNTVFQVIIGDNWPNFMYNF